MKKIFGLFIICLFTACSHRNSQHLRTSNPEDVAISCYEALAKKDYNAYVSAMHSYDSIPDAYKQRQIVLLKQYIDAINKNYGGIVGIEVSKAKTKKYKDAAEIYIILHFKNKQKEEILVSLMRENNQWKLR